MLIHDISPGRVECLFLRPHSSDIRAKAPQGGKAPGDLPCALSDTATTACSLADKTFHSSDENRHQLAGVPPDRLGVSSVSQARFQRLCSVSALYRAFLPSLLRQVAAGPNDFCGKRTTRRTADVGIFAGSYPGRVGCRNMSGHAEDGVGTGTHPTNIDGDVRGGADWGFIFPQFTALGTGPFTGG